MARLALLTLFLCLSSTLTLGGGTKPSPDYVVDVGYAQYKGVFNVSAGVTQFLGVRFADPPTGKYRFQVPQPPSTVKGVLLADTEPPECPQGLVGKSSTTPFSKRQTALTEDCLFLNVIVPGELNPHSKLPVVVWVHGGGYVGGSQAYYDGVDLVHDSQDGAIAVVIQYRLGAFGFLPGKEIAKNGALNAGLLDQNFALQWVQKHISLFGGDPSKVTIWGESAGAGSVLQHIVAHGGKTEPPLFRAAMTSSTFLPSQFNFDDVIPEQVYTDVVQAAGCSSFSDTFKCLQDVDVDTLEAANQAVGAAGFYGVYVFVPVVDGTFIVERPIETLQKGNHNGELLLSVTNEFEGVIFVNASLDPTSSLSDYVEQLFPTLSTSQVASVANEYTNIGLNGTYNQAVGVMGESIFICPTYRLLAAFPGESHKGEFAIPPAIHGEDVSYYFTTSFPEARSFNNVTFIKSFSQSFLAVVMHLDPNDTPDSDNITPDWPQYNDGNTEMLFNVTTTNQTEIHTIHTTVDLIKRCNLWESLAPVIGQ